MKILDKQIIERYNKLDVTCVSDAMDRFGLMGGLLGLKSIVPGKSICGQAFTVRYLPCGSVKATTGEYLDDVLPGQVVVIDNGGLVDCTVWGDIMSLAAMRNGIAGTVINGVCRDVPNIKKMGYPVFSRGSYMITGKGRVLLAGVNEMISICGVQVNPGDIVMCDDSGSLVVPCSHAEKILEAAEEINSKESLIVKELKKGHSLKETREKIGYHQLQSRISE
jgi:4-hydroxy-4-methyl-2-oxoglutarate aldolase